MVTAPMSAAVWFEAFRPVCISANGSQITFWIRFLSDQSPGPSRCRTPRVVAQALQGTAPLFFDFVDGICRACGKTVTASPQIFLGNRRDYIAQSGRTCSIPAPTVHSPSKINCFYSLFTPLPQIFAES